VWCGDNGQQMIGQYIFPQLLTGDIYANHLQDDLRKLIENVPVQTRRQIFLPARRSAASFQSDRQAVSVS